MNRPLLTSFVPEGPTPLLREMPEPGLFPVDALGSLAQPTKAIARATEAPVAMCAASVLAACSLAAQGFRDVETLHGTAPASLFLLTVAESGERKSTIAAQELLSDPMANGQGLLARFLTCRPPSRIGMRVRMEKDPAAEEQIKNFAARTKALLSRELPLAEGHRNELAPPLLPLADDARDVLVEFARQVEEAQAQGGPFEDIRAFASKTAEHAARIAAVLTIYADPNASEVTGETMAGAVELATFYVNEAARLADAAIVPPEVADAERMRRWLLTSWTEPCISAGIAAQRGPFKVTDRARKALRHLEKHGWIIEDNGAEVSGKARKEAWRIVRDIEP